MSRSRAIPLVSLRGALLVVSALLFSASVPAVARAQAAASAAPIFAGEDLDTPPKLVNPTKTARVVSDSYPANLRRMGVGGSVQVQFVIDPNGKVEPESIEVLQASTPAFGDAAREAARKIEFHPGKSKGQTVRTKVLLPIVYK
jgi:periplasmic protein TonB